MRNERVLIVDDDPLIREILRELLADNYELMLAASGEEALESAVTFRPDLILMDVSMEGMSGYEACRRLRKLASLAAVKIILLSGGILSDEPEGLAAGADDCVGKPFDPGELFDKMEALLKRKATG